MRSGSQRASTFAKLTSSVRSLFRRKKRRTVQTNKRILVEQLERRDLFAAVSYSGGTYSENFDTLTTSTSSQTWSNATTLAGWELYTGTGAAITTYLGGNGSVNTGSFYSFGATGVNERSLGGAASGGSYFGSPAPGAVAGYIAVGLTNATGSNLSQVTIDFDGEQWRNGGNATAQTMVLEYGFGATFATVGTWTAPGGSFDSTTPVNSNPAVPSNGTVDGNVAGLIDNRGGTLNGVPWTAGQTLWIRWIERNDFNNDHGIGVDNFTLTASSAADNTPPTLSSTTPVDGATNVAVDTNLVMTFSENVQKGTGNVTIHNALGGMIVQTIPITDPSVTVSGSQVTVNPALNLSAGTGFYINVAAGAIEDLSGNDFAGILDATTWNFETANPDVTPPIVTALSPADNSSTSFVETNLGITFNENVLKGSGNITIRRSSDNSVFETIDVASAAVAITGAQVTINPTTDLAAGTGYYVEIAVGAFTDLSFNNFAGIADSTTWNFSTAASSTLTAGDIAFVAFNADGNDDIAFVALVNIPGSQAMRFVDKAWNGTAFATGEGEFQWLSPAAGVSAGTIVVISNVSNPGANPISANIGTAVGGTGFSSTGESVFAITGTVASPGTFLAAITTNTASLTTFNGTGLVAGVTAVDFTVSAREHDVIVFNGLRNNQASFANYRAIVNNPTNWISEDGTGDQHQNGTAPDLPFDTTPFSLGSDVTPPVITSLSPADNAFNVPGDSNLVVTFNEPVVKGTGNITIFLASDDTVVQTIAVTDAAVSISDAVVTINPPANLADFTEFYVLLDAGTFEDIAGNDFAGLSDTTGWSFTTSNPDITPPAITSLSPADNSMGVLATTNLVIGFDENVKKGTGNFTIHLASNGNVVQTIDVNDAAVTVTGANVTINPADLSPATAYYVLFAGTAIEDNAGNDSAGISDSTTWNFTTAATSTLNTGDIAFIGYNADGADDFAFVLLKSIGELEVIRFTDNEWIGSEFTIGEGEIVWVAPSGGASAGTVVTLNAVSSAATITTNVGSVFGTFNVGASDEAIFAITGTQATPGTFLTAISNRGSTGFTSLTGTGLVAGTNALDFGGTASENHDVLIYNAARNDKTTFADYRAVINNPANWLTQDGGGDQSNDGTAPDLPFNTTPFTLAPSLPSLVSVVVNGGDTFTNANQRSQVTSVVVTTSGPLSDPLTAFTLTNIGLFVAGNNQLASSQILVTSSGNVYTLRFGAGAGVTSRSGSNQRGNSLADGNWVLGIASTQIAGNNTFGAAAADRFFRMFGDSDGDGDVDGGDTGAFRNAQSSYNAAMDWDGNGSVSIGPDSVNFSLNKNKRRRSF